MAAMPKSRVSWVTLLKTDKPKRNRHISFPFIIKHINIRIISEISTQYFPFFAVKGRSCLIQLTIRWIFRRLLFL